MVSTAVGTHVTRDLYTPPGTPLPAGGKVRRVVEHLSGGKLHLDGLVSSNSATRSTLSSQENGQSKSKAAGRRINAQHVELVSTGLRTIEQVCPVSGGSSAE